MDCRDVFYVGWGWDCVGSRVWTHDRRGIAAVCVCLGDGQVMTDADANRECQYAHFYIFSLIAIMSDEYLACVAKIVAAHPEWRKP